MSVQSVTRSRVSKFVERLIRSAHGANSMLTASDWTFAPRGSQGSWKSNKYTNQESCFINPKKDFNFLINQETSPPRRRPCLGGAERHQTPTPSSASASASHFLLSARKGKEIRERMRQNTEKEKNRLRGGGYCLRGTGDWGTAREGTRRTTEPRGTAKERWRCGSCRTPWKWEGERGEGERRDGVEGFSFWNFFYVTLFFIFVYWYIRLFWFKFFWLENQKFSDFNI